MKNSIFLSAIALAAGVLSNSEVLAESLQSSPVPPTKVQLRQPLPKACRNLNPSVLPWSLDATIGVLPAPMFEEIYDGALKCRSFCVTRTCA